MTKDNVETRLETIENKLDSLAGSAYPMMGGQFSSTGDDEIDLRELWNVIWQGKWIIIATTFVFAVFSVFYALSLPNIYKSEALLAPADENAGGGLAGLAGQFGGLASLAGVNLGGGGDKTTLAIEVLKSREFVSKFIKKHELLIPLMASEGWDRSRDELKIDPDIYDVKNGKWIRTPKPPRTAEPSMQEAHKVFSKNFSVTQDKISNFVSMGFEFYSPTLTKQWVDLLIQDINLEIKSRDVAEARRSIEYLTGQLGKTSVADMKTIFYELIEEQSKTIMFAEVRDEYVFKTIDEAVVPELKSKPKKALICTLAVILGGMLSVVAVFVRHFLQVKK